MNIPRELLTSRETAKLLGISRSTVMNHYHAGIIPARRIGRFLRFDADAVLAAYKAREQQLAEGK